MKTRSNYSTSPKKEGKDKPDSNSQNHLCGTKGNGKSKGLVNAITHNISKSDEITLPAMNWYRPWKNAYSFQWKCIFA